MMKKILKLFLLFFIVLLNSNSVKAYYGKTINKSIGFSTKALNFSATTSTNSFLANSNQVVTIPVAVQNNSSFAVSYSFTLSNSNLKFSGGSTTYTGTIAANTTSTVNLNIIEVVANGTDTTNLNMTLNTPYSKTISLGSYSLIFDNSAPTLAVSVSSGTTYAKSRTATITLSDSGGSGLVAGTYTIKYAWGTSAVACADMTSTTSITVAAGATSGTASVTINSGTGAGKIYVCNSAAISDRSGNSLAASTTKNANMYLDNTAPDISVVDVDGNSLTTYYQTRTIKLRISDSHSKLVNETYSIKYALGASTSNYTCDSTEMTYTATITPTSGAATADSSEISLSGVQSSYIYICNISAIKDALNNTLAANTVTKKSIFVDGIGPSISVSVSSGTTYAKSKSATIKLSASYSKIPAGSYNIYYAWSTSVVACANMTNYVTLTLESAGTSVQDTVTISSGTGNGKIYICNKTAIADQVGNQVAANTIKNASMYLDNTAPVCTWSAWNDSYIKNNVNTTITLTCTDSHSGVAMDLASSDITVSNTAMGSIAGVIKDGTNTNRTYVITFTGGSTNGTPTLTLPASVLQDVAGNFAATKTSSSIIVDNNAPTLAVSVSNGTTYAKSRAATITLADSGGSGFAAGTYTIKYAWGTSAVSCANMTLSTNIAVSAGATSKTASVTINSGTGAGKIYVCNSAAIQDRAGNSLTASTVANANMYLDNTAPTVPIVSARYADGSGTYTSGTWTNKQVYTDFTTTEAIGPITIQRSVDGGSTWYTNMPMSVQPFTQSGTTWSGTESWNLYDRNEVLYFRVCDGVGNCSGATSGFNLRYDVTPPIGNVNITNNFANTQTASYYISDNYGIASYFFDIGGSELIAANGETSIGSANNPRTFSITSNANYYLKAVDLAGNVYVSPAYPVFKTIFNTVNATMSPSYVLTPSGESFVLPRPTPNSGYENDTIWYKNSSYSTTLGAIGADYIVNSSSTIYFKAKTSVRSSCAAVKANGGSINGLFKDSTDSNRCIFSGGTGSTVNNYVKLPGNNSIWRIISVEANNVIKIVANTPYNNTKIQYKADGTNVSWDNSLLKSTLNTAYSNNTLVAESDKKYFTATDYNVGDITYGSDSTTTLATTYSKEKGTVKSLTVGTLTATDYIKASSACTSTSKWNSTCPKSAANNWLYKSSSSDAYWIMNVYSDTRARRVDSSVGGFGIGYLYATDNHFLYPVLAFKADVIFSGTGTASDPYIPIGGGTNMPICTWGNWGKTIIGLNGTTSITLTCTDADNDITSPALTASSFQVPSGLSITNVTSTNVTNGKKYTITVKGVSAVNNARITLPATAIYDSSGNHIASKSTGTIGVVRMYILASGYTYNYYSGPPKSSSSGLSSAGSCSGLKYFNLTGTEFNDVYFINTGSDCGVGYYFYEISSKSYWSRQ